MPDTAANCGCLGAAREQGRLDRVVRPGGQQGAQAAGRYDRHGFAALLAGGHGLGQGDPRGVQLTCPELRRVLGEKDEPA